MNEPAVETADAVAAADVVDAGVDATVELAELRAQLETAQKRAEFAEQGYAAARKPSWMEEAQRKNPELAALVGKEGFAAIEATSRRGYLREAERLAELHAPSIAQLKAMRASATERIDEAREQARLEARAEVQEAWGKPASDLIGPPAPAKDDKAEVLKRLVEG